MILKEESTVIHLQKHIILIDLHRVIPRRRANTTLRYKFLNEERILPPTVLKSLKKPSKLDNYNITRDQDEHIKHMDIMLDFHHAWSSMKLYWYICKGPIRGGVGGERHPHYHPDLPLIWLITYLLDVAPSLANMLPSPWITHQKRENIVCDVF